MDDNKEPSEMSDKEFALHKQNEELLSKIVKQDAQRKMAWTALIAILAATGTLFLPLLTNEKIETLLPMLDWFYIANASIVGAYMGMTAWMSKK